MTDIPYAQKINFSSYIHEAQFLRHNTVFMRAYGIRFWLTPGREIGRNEVNTEAHGLINYIDSKAKCRHLNKFTCKGICGMCLSVWGLFHPMTPYPPSSHCILYTLLNREERGRGGEMNQREGLRGNSSKSWVVILIPTWQTETVSPV